jgi:hypothetical protein
MRECGCEFETIDRKISAFSGVILEKIKKFTSQSHVFNVPTSDEKFIHHQHDYPVRLTFQCFGRKSVIKSSISVENCAIMDGSAQVNSAIHNAVQSKNRRETLEVSNVNSRQLYIYFCSQF